MKKSTTPVSSGSTIYDVAELAEVSISTVSRLLNHPDKVNEATRAKVQHAMDRLAYIPHGNTGTKAERRVGRIGVLTPFSPAPSFVQRLQGMTPVFRQAHCEMVIYTVESSDQLEDYLRSVPFQKRLDGLIIMSMRIAEADFHRLADAGVEVVLIENHHPLFSGVEADNIRGGALAAGHFLEKGLWPCAFVGEKVQPQYSLRPSELRWQGYRSALAEAGHPVSGAHVRLGEGTVADGNRMGRELLASADRPRAVFAMSDLQAIGLLKAARDLGLRVPQDVAVLGFDDIEAAEYLDLSTVSQSLNESGRVAAELLIGRIREPGRPLQTVQLKVAVVPRATT
jgi:LacI family transcriptional regulator